MQKELSTREQFDLLHNVWRLSSLFDFVFSLKKKKKSPEQINNLSPIYKDLLLFEYIF